MKRRYRTEVIHVRVTKRERADLEERATRLGYASISDYIRNAVRWIAAHSKAAERGLL